MYMYMFHCVCVCVCVIFGMLLFLYKDIDVDDHLMEEWFSLVNEKNMLVREESGLVYELRDLELIEQHDQLEKEIRQRVSKDGETT